MSRAPFRMLRMLPTLCVAAVWLAAADASAQSVRVEVSRQPPYYVGEPVEVRVHVDGFDEEPTPEVRVAPPRGGRLEYAGVSPSVSTSIVIVGGKVEQTKDVSFVFSYRLFVDEPAEVRVGPFQVEQEGTTATTRPLQLAFTDVPSDERLSIAVELPDQPVYVGERVPVTLRMRLEGSLWKNFAGQSLRVPMFDRSDVFQFLDPEESEEKDETEEAGNESAIDLEIQTAEGPRSVRAVVRESERDGVPGVDLIARRIAVPLQEGTLAIPPAVANVREGVRFRRDLFGTRRPTQVRLWRARDVERTLEVRRIPAERTPPSFAGAVGSGFSLSVTADRTVVQVGEPISLTLELRGEGNLETAALPRLDAEGLLPAGRFRVPDGELTGVLDGGTKRFSATVRVLDPSVHEIPALAYTWFDPKAESFAETRSRPIALSVRDAEVIGAADVQREVRADETDGAAVPGAPGEGGGLAARRGPLALTGADLAIERDPERLLAATGAGGSRPWLVGGLYVGSLALVGLATFDRRRRDVDPVVVARRKRVEAEIERIRAAAALPAPEAAGQLAGALRQIRAEHPDAGDAELDAFLGECDARSYAPEGQRDDAPLGEEFHARALAFAQRLGEGGA